MADDPPSNSLNFIGWENNVPKEGMGSTLAALVGAVVIYYAMIEHWLDGIVFCIHERVDGAKKVRKHHPYNARDEVEFLTECFTRLPPLRPFKDDALTLLEKLEPLAVFRHSVVHGHIRNIEWNMGVIEFSRKLKGPKGEPIVRVLTIQAEQLFNQSRNIKDLILPFNDLTQRLLETFDPTYPRK